MPRNQKGDNDNIFAASRQTNLNCDTEEMKGPLTARILHRVSGAANDLSVGKFALWAKNCRAYNQKRGRICLSQRPSNERVGKIHCVDEKNCEALIEGYIVVAGLGH
jgi:hypothetical protein